MADNTLTNQFKALLDSLREEIKNKHKVKILSLYDEINAFDFKEIPDNLLDEYEDLTSIGNDILYE